MAKAQGIIGNFKGKIGNTVGYQLTSSNNKQTQGIRIYQPNVKNPKTSAQAEQRAKLAPINATYRALKMVIDRGNEGLPYGNKSRLAWLKQAFMSTQMPWVEKGMLVGYPVGCQLTKGSLQGICFSVDVSELTFDCAGVTSESSVNTIGAVSTLLKAGYPSLKDGDQITIVTVHNANSLIDAVIDSFVIDTTSTVATTQFEARNGAICVVEEDSTLAGAIIVSRQGDNGEHLRSNTSLYINPDDVKVAPYDAASKTAAIESYMASGAANTDWAEESIK